MNFEKSRDEHAIIMSQIGDADLVLLSKVKEAGSERTERVKKFVENIGVHTRVVLWDDELKPEEFLNSKITSQRDSEIENHEHNHAHEKYDEYWFKSNKQIDLRRFTEIMKNLPQNIVRSKGYINIDGRKIMIQYVSGTCEMSHAEWENEMPHTVVLYIGKGIDKELLDQSLKRCEV